MFESALYDLLKFGARRLTQSPTFKKRFPEVCRRFQGAEKTVWDATARARLNAWFDGEARVHGPFSKIPSITDGKPVILNQAEALQRAIWLKHLESRAAPNDPHGIIAGEVNWQDNPIHLWVDRADYAQVKALRSVAETEGRLPPRVLSANALAVCAEDRLLMLHRRSPDSATYPAHLHTIGGAYWPPGFDNRGGDEGDIWSTAVREVREETNISLSDDCMGSVLILEELKTGFVQVAFLGCAIKSSVRARVKVKAEGNVSWVGFDELGESLRSEKSWVPTGKAAVLAWLAMGAPGAGSRPRFNGRKPADLFAELIGGDA